uniref:Protein HID1 n=1 Tax=Ditylenchus dipsaci TaxID=166011 RepID=A0A915EFL1_9BILA
MGNAETKVDFRKAVLDLTSKNQKLDDATFWNQFWPSATSPLAKDVFNMIPQADIRALRENSPNNLATLCFKSVDTLIKARDAMCPATDHKKVINCLRLLTRIIPFMLEDAEWRSYFWTALPTENKEDASIPIAAALLSALSDLLFCPNFTIAPPNNTIESLASLDSCECIWQAGVGFANKTPLNATFDANRTEILKLLLTVFSEVIYAPVTEQNRMRWITRFSSAENRHVLPLFTSLLNVVCSYDPVGYGLPYNYLLVNDSREPLVQAAIQVLIVCLDRESQPQNEESGYVDNFFVNYLSRIHREDDFDFMLKGLTRLLNNPLQASYLPNSSKKVMFHQELLVLLWKCCEYNQKFMYYVLKTSDVLEILVRSSIISTTPEEIRLELDLSTWSFLDSLVKWRKKLGVRLNKPFSSRGIIDVQAFTGTHADLLIIVCLSQTNYHRQPTTSSLFDCLLTIIVNVSPYLKSLSMVTANKLVHLVEAFSTPCVYCPKFEESKSKNGGPGDSTEKGLPTPSPWVAQAESGSTAASSSAPQMTVEGKRAHSAI